MAAAYAMGDYSMRAITDEFGMHCSTVSRTINKQEMR
jgi:DNA-directed RNA polymerase specialized sigma54-like protein